MEGGRTDRNKDDGKRNRLTAHPQTLYCEYFMLGKGNTCYQKIKTGAVGIHAADTMRSEFTFADLLYNRASVQTLPRDPR